MASAWRAHRCTDLGPGTTPTAGRWESAAGDVLLVLVWHH